MDIGRLLNLDATLTTVTADTVDVYGDPTDSPTSTAVKCWIDRRGTQRDADELVGDADWQIELLDLYLPPGTAATGRDRLTVRGVEYEIIGPPHEHIHPVTGQPVYVEARIRRAT